MISSAFRQSCRRQGSRILSFSRFNVHNVAATASGASSDWNGLSQLAHNTSYQPVLIQIHPYHSTPRHFTEALKPSSQETLNLNPSTFANLNAKTIEAIKADLLAADKNHDGKIDAEELKDLLRRHSRDDAAASLENRKHKFTDKEIVELGELFYAASGAQGVEIERFLHALDHAVENTGFEDPCGAKGGMEGEISPVAAKGKFKTHPLGIGTCATEYMYVKSHGAYTPEELDVKITHIPPETTSDKIAFFAVKLFRFGFDTFTLWNVGSITQSKILNRAIFLETVAGIPGMVAAIIRHFRSLRNMTRDGGMMNMFLEEANNERMHLLTFIRMKDPGMIFRAAVVLGQAGFGTGFLILYLISPAFCHRFVGYIEEEAVHTYTKIVDAIEGAEEGSELAKWRTESAPKIAKAYWQLGENGTVLDMVKAVRADEAEHRDVNHAVSGVAEDTINPLYDPREKLDSMLKKYVESIMERSDAKDVAK